MKYILVSGGSGFVGQNLISHLHTRNCRFILVKKSGIQRDNGDQSILWKDVDEVATKDIDTYIHLAGKAHDLKQIADDSEYFAVNTELTKVLFDTFLRSDAKDFIYFSSVKAVADTVDGILEEQHTPNPLTAYGKSKQLAEEYILNRSLPVGKRIFIIRPCMIHGPGNKGNLNLLYKVVEKGIPYPLAAFNNSRSFLSIDNLNYIIERIITDQSIPGGVYNLADDDALSTNELIKIISKASNRKPKLWNINPGLIKGLAKLGDILKLPLNSERLKKLTESYVVSNDKIKKALHIEQLPISAEEGLFTTIRSFRSTE